MLFTPFNRTWWKSLVKGESDGETNPDEPLIDDVLDDDLEDGDLEDGDLEDGDLEEASPSLELNSDEGGSDRPQATDGAPEVSRQGTDRPNNRGGDNRRRNDRGRSGNNRNDRNARSRRPETDSSDDHDDDADQEPFTHEGQPGDLGTDDPLAPAFDLDRGAPLPPAAQAHHNAQEPHVNVRSAKEFFNAEILYRFDILEERDRQELQGSFRIELKGYQGGIWTVNVKDSVDVVNRREDAEIVITMHQKDFMQLVNGQLNPQLAIFAQKMRVQGDLRRCISFDRLLTPYQD